MLLLKLKHLRVERWILEDACREIGEYAQNAGLEIDPAADDADFNVFVGPALIDKTKTKDE